MAEPIIVILQTWERTDCAVRTIRAALRNLIYTDLRWYVADDGSRPEHVDVVLSELAQANLIGWHSERRGYGGNMNAAMDVAEQTSVLFFALEDDWELRRPLDLYQYACLLMETEAVGMVRLGTLNLDIRARSWAHGGHVYWTLDRAPHIEGTPVFTGHPSLRHRRYRLSHGDYPVGLTPGDTELAYAYAYRWAPQNAPGIVWPADYPAQGFFGHIGSVKTETML